MVAQDSVVRYAVVGMGYIAQAAALPAFAHARRNSRLAAMVSGDPRKLQSLGRRRPRAILASYDDYDRLLRSGEVDAVFIALPNHMHHEFTVRAAQAGVHVLCEKPMAGSEAECADMIAACEAGGVRLMIAYRLHFEEATLRALDLAHSGRLGDVRAFHAAFTMQVRDPSNIRLDRDKAGGPLYDIGIYCINAARMLFRDEPIAVQGLAAAGNDPRFREVAESYAVNLAYPGGRLASFVCGFGSSDVSMWEAIGSRGRLRMEPAFEFSEGLGFTTETESGSRTRRFSKRDQFAAELLYFSDCILRGREPEPSGLEGLLDVRIIEAVMRSAMEGQTLRLVSAPPREPQPTMEQMISKPGVREPRLVGARSPSGEG